MTDIFSGLNPPQRKAVEHTDGPLLILAGAGTGKTRVLTTRLAHVLMSGKAQPHEILAVTFTNKAAKEMAERVGHLLGQPAVGMWLGTFHALCARLLRQHAESIGLKRDFVILDTDDQHRLLENLLAEANIDQTRYPVRVLAHVISRWKDNGWDVPDVPTAEHANFDGKAVGLYAAYQKRLLAQNTVDFGDLLLKAVILLKNSPEILNRYQQQWRYVLVDEYQDTNAVQYLWLRLITMGHKNIAVVGDDDQSIYAWRGAQVGNILRFEKDFPGAEVVRLEQNYRSTGTILKAASHLISHNRERHGKELWTTGDAGDLIEIHPLMDGREEARLVADRIGKGLKNNQAYTDFAVLVRTAAQTRAIEERFIQSGIPYTIVGGQKFYDRKEIKDAVAYLRLVHNPLDDLAFERIINVPKRGVGESTLKAIRDRVQIDASGLLKATQTLLERQELGGKARGSLQVFVDMVAAWQQAGGDATPDRLLEKVLEQSGYLDMLKTDKDPDTKTRLDNLKELVRALQEYTDVSSFLEHAALVAEGQESSGEVVRISTIHAAKGLEFDTVFLPGFEDGLFPHQRVLNEEGNKGLEEERRLAYVAITRAKRKLIICYAASRLQYGQFSPCIPSRFIKELPEGSYKMFSPTYGSSAYGGAYRPAVGSTLDVKSRAHDSVKPAEPFITSSQPVVEKQADAYPLGSRVFHQKFGYGHVKTLEGKGVEQKLVIAFEKAGDKKLVAQLAGLEKV